MPDVTDFKNYRIGQSTELDRSMGYISKDFEAKVLSHIVGNYAGSNICPLYLAIHGPMGNGKTFQTLRICSAHHVTMYYISAAELSGSYEKDSIYQIQRNLEQARELYRKDHEYSVFIIDDFHLSIASTEAGVGKTVNSQLLTGFLMNLADTASQSKTQRIPFILLGNDFNNLYGPLTRDGRMDFFEWNPSEEEKVKIVIYSMMDLIYSRPGKEELKSLVVEYSKQPVSFFTELRHDLYKEDLNSYVLQNKRSNIANLISEYDKNKYFDESYVLEKIKLLAKRRCDNRVNASVVHESREGLTNG